MEANDSDLVGALGTVAILITIASEEYLSVLGLCRQQKVGTEIPHRELGP